MSLGPFIDRISLKFEVEHQTCNFFASLYSHPSSNLFSFLSYDIQVIFKLIWCVLHQLRTVYQIIIFKTISIVLYVLFILNMYDIFISIKFYLSYNVSCSLFNLIKKKKKLDI